MSMSSIEALASAWARIAEEAEFPADYEGTATPEAHRASEAIQEWIREHIVTTNDMRLFGLLHLLGQASLRMEQTLWPEEYERMTREVEEALRKLPADRSREGLLHEMAHAHRQTNFVVKLTRLYKSCVNDGPVRPHADPQKLRR